MGATQPVTTQPVTTQPVTTQPVTTQCRECQSGSAHCHGTLIRHPGRRDQCTEPECEHAEVLLHSLTVDCEAIGCECCGQDDRRLAV